MSATTDDFPGYGNRPMGARGSAPTTPAEPQPTKAQEEVWSRILRTLPLRPENVRAEAIGSSVSIAFEWIDPNPDRLMFHDTFMAHVIVGPRGGLKSFRVSKLSTGFVSQGRRRGGGKRGRFAFWSALEVAAMGMRGWRR